MSLDWIKEAEKRQESKKQLINEIKFSENTIINENHNLLKPHIDYLTQLVDRVAAISPDERKPSMEIGHTHLIGDNHYEYYGSAFINKTKYRFFIIKTNVLYINWRRIFFKIPEEPGLVKIVLHEKSTNQLKKNDKKKKRTKYKFQIEEINNKIIEKMLDWIAFRIDEHELKRYLPKNHY
ncbi:MAG: hypothetical protein Kow0068_17100 [Marinilabiliales bacterium]